MRTRPDVTRKIQLPDGEVEVDEAGYLVDPEHWTGQFAQFVADEEGIALSQQHWDVIAFMREYLEEHGIAPDARFVLDFLREPEHLDKHDGKVVLFELFPYGYVKQACKMAGMRQPRA